MEDADPRRRVDRRMRRRLLSAGDRGAVRAGAPEESSIVEDGEITGIADAPLRSAKGGATLAGEAESEGDGARRRPTAIVLSFRFPGACFGVVSAAAVFVVVDANVLVLYQKSQPLIHSLGGKLERQSRKVRGRGR